MRCSPSRSASTAVLTGTSPSTSQRRPRTAFLRIANSGPQVPPEVVPSLFEPFRRLEGRIGGDGAGLGLAIARSVAAVHGTTVQARSRPAGGLDVEVTLAARGSRQL